MPSSSQALFQAAKQRADKLEATGKPYEFAALLKAAPDAGTTNICNTSSKHWTRWLGPVNRCLVPFTSFSEWDGGAKEPVWFAAGAERPLMVFAGIWTTWTSARKAQGHRPRARSPVFPGGTLRAGHPRRLLEGLCSLSKGP